MKYEKLEENQYFTKEIEKYVNGCSIMIISNVKYKGEEGVGITIIGRFVGKLNMFMRVL